ncbi:hypothetical protein CPB86DRAFT_869892 [Serendipita vermifera]|nr:hypothetical protein CPB86DRAFT_869892 [Serendipita vermifera]
MSHLWAQIREEWKRGDWVLRTALILIGGILLSLLVSIFKALYILYLFELPTWKVFTSLCAVAALENTQILPFKYLWDPNHRILYPNGQIGSWERLATKALSHIARFLSPRRTPRLPPEIWGMILSGVIDEPFIFDTTCDSKDFYQFINSFNNTFSQVFRKHEYKSESQRRKLRLVCKMWAELMDLHSMRWVSPLRAGRATGKGTKRLDIIATNHRNVPLHRHWNPEKEVVNSILTNNQTQGSLSRLSLEFQKDELVEQIDHHILLPNYRTSSLRAFSYIQEKGRLSTLLTELQERFSSLTTLHLDIDEIHGPLRLDRLECLYLNTKRYDANQWWFSSLRHCALGNLVTSTYGYDPSLVCCPKDQLLSLYLVRNNLHFELDDKFWHHFPRLEFLGATSSRFSMSHNAPMSHPLKYLVFDDWPWDFDSAAYSRATELSSRIPNLKQTTIPVYPRPNINGPVTNDACIALFIRLHERGVEWVDRDGDGFACQQVINYHEKTQVEKLIPLFYFFHITLHCSYSLMTGPWSPLLSQIHTYLTVLVVLSFIRQVAIWVYDCYWAPTYTWIRTLSVTN